MAIDASNTVTYINNVVLYTGKIMIYASNMVPHTTNNYISIHKNILECRNIYFNEKQTS